MGRVSTIRYSYRVRPGFRPGGRVGHRAEGRRASTRQRAQRFVEGPVSAARQRNRTRGRENWTRGLVSDSDPAGSRCTDDYRDGIAMECGSGRANSGRHRSTARTSAMIRVSLVTGGDGQSSCGGGCNVN